MKFAGIIPLVGGMDIGAAQAFGSRPEYLMSYKPFWANDRHLVSHYNNEVPYVVLDDGGRVPGKVDVVHSTCPCAGLSLLSRNPNPDSAWNDWMYTAAEYVLGDLGPEVYYGENAPTLATSLGAPVRDRLRLIGLKHGYSMSTYRTRAALHGLAQTRERSFYFFWKGDRTPVLEYFHRPQVTIEETIASATGNTQREPICSKTPSRDDAFYRYLLEGLHGGIGHREYAAMKRPREGAHEDVQKDIELADGVGAYARAAKWMTERGYEREAKAALRRDGKLADGKGLMYKRTIVPNGKIGAFVNPYPVILTHPVEDRYISFREAMTIMGLPQDFELLEDEFGKMRSGEGKDSGVIAGMNWNTSDNGKTLTRNLPYNHLCQNVPVQVARDIAGEVRAYLEGKRPTVAARFVHQSNHARTHHEYDADAPRPPRASLQEAFA